MSGSSICFDAPVDECPTSCTMSYLGMTLNLKPHPADPKVWFPSAESLVKVLSDKNRMLLGTIRDAEPKSLAELAELTGRKTSNLSRTLKTMERYGIVKLERQRRGRVIARVPYQSVTVDLSLSCGARWTW